MEEVNFVLFKAWRRLCLWEKRARLEGEIDNKERTVDSSKSGNGCDPVYRCRD